MPDPMSRDPEPFSDRALDLAGRMLAVVLEEPNERIRIDALAAVANAGTSMRRDHPKAWRRLTTHDWTGRPIAAPTEEERQHE